jgi:hypothetical protein
VIIGFMSLARLLARRVGHGRRLPDRIEDLRGPSGGVIVLPRHLSWPGMREFDITDAGPRRSMYGIVLTQGQRNDVKRFLNPALLRQDWPVLRAALDPPLRRWCERRFGLPAAAGPGAHAAPPGPSRVDAPAADTAVLDAPVLDAPVLDAPVVDAPATGGADRGSR